MTLSHYATLIDTMARLSLKADASRYFFGYVWWVLEPLLYVLVFYVVFELILQNRKEDFVVFLMCGQLAFVWFSKSLNQASRSILGSKGLVGRVDIPKSLFPLATIQEGLYKQAAVFLLLFVVLFAKGYTPSLVWGWLLPVMLVNYLLIVACSLFAAYLVCWVFDFHVFISMATIFLMFTSGVFWDPRDLDPAMTHWVLTLNPLAFLLDAYRQIMLADMAPNAVHLAIIGGIALLVVLAGLFLLRRHSRFIALRVITS
jgi:lipopolysaccharide transport system permease protein